MNSTKKIIVQKKKTFLKVPGVPGLPDRHPGDSEADEGHPRNGQHTATHPHLSDGMFIIAV